MSSAHTQFSIAVHVLSGIAKYENLSSTDLAASVNTSPIFLKRILAKLSKAGLIRTTPGRTGGSVLARKAQDISLFDVYQAVDTPKAFAIHSYPTTKSCEISSNIQNVMSNVLDEVQWELETKLKNKSIEDVLKEIKKKRR